MFKKQLFYSLSWLAFVATFVWLLLATHSPADVKALQNLEYHEDGQFKHFLVQAVSQTTFLWIRWGGLALLLLIFGCLQYFFKGNLRASAASVLKAIQYCKNVAVAEIRNTSPAENIVLGITFLLLIAERGYYVLQYPIHSDEAASFLFFIKNGFWATTTYYPIPNNHILQNLLALPLSWVLQEPFWVLRLPPIFCSFLVTIVGYFGLKRYTDFTNAYLATAFFSFASFTLFLSTQGRGYMLLTFCVVLATFFLIKALQKNRPGFWTGFTICCTLGFYTVPVFLYPFGGFILLAFVVTVREPLRLFSLAVATLTILASTVILYFPVGLISGWAALLDNKYVLPLPREQFWQELPGYAKGTQDLLLGLRKSNGYFLFLASTFLALGSLFSFKSKRTKNLFPRVFPFLAGICIAVNICTIALIFKQSVLPPPRTLFFKSYLDFILVALVLTLPLKLLLKNTLVRGLVLFAGLFVFGYFQVKETERFLKDYPTPYYNFPALNSQILESGAEKAFVTEQFYQLFLKYEFARAGKNIQIDTQKPQANKAYDYVVIPKETGWPSGLDSTIYKEVYRDEVVKAFRPVKNW